MIFFSDEIKNKIVELVVHTHIPNLDTIFTALDTTAHICRQLQFPCQNPALDNITLFVRNIIMDIQVIISRPTMSFPQF